MNIITKKVIETGLLNKDLVFECAADNILTYHYVGEGLIHEFNIICDHPCFKIEKVSELIGKPFGYLSYSVNEVIGIDEDGEQVTERLSHTEILPNQN